MKNEEFLSSRKCRCLQKNIFPVFLFLTITELKRFCVTKRICVHPFNLWLGNNNPLNLYALLCKIPLLQ